MAGEHSYNFGHLTWDGESYREDVLILPNRVICPWRREHGHRLNIGDLLDVVAARPQVLIIGSGSAGMMKVPEAVLDALAARGMDCEILPTAKALRRFVELRRRKPTAAALHLTC